MTQQILPRVKHAQIHLESKNTSPSQFYRQLNTGFKQTENHLKYTRKLYFKKFYEILMFFFPAVI